jgi:hypothetical protein
VKDREDGTELGGWEPSEDAEAWRGDDDVECWPEELAGPEYWAYRRREDVERVVNELVGERTARHRGR